MKILALRFTNLNSLQGSWEIDFTHPSFSSEGIFAITGRTGSGKSTILDAICLALFGQTPRLKSITASANDIMSRHTGECMAEVDFSTHKGDFRVTWRQNRARKKIDGALQPPKHTLAELESEMFLTEKTTDTVRAVEEATGLNFTRFTRSVLLAQGSFAAFLQARDDERSDVLEQLTGTEIYSDISIAVFEQAKEEREKLARLEESVQDLRLLSPEELEALNELLREEEKKRGIFEQERESLENALNWFESVARLEQELQAIAEAKSNHEQEMMAFAPSRRALVLAQKGLELDGAYTELKNQRVHKTELEKQAATNKNSLAEHERELERLFRRRQDAEKNQTALRRQHQAERLTHIKVRELDMQLGELMKNQRKAHATLLRQQADAKEASGKSDSRRKEIVNAYENGFRLFCQRLVRSSHHHLADGYWPLENLGQQLVEVIEEQHAVRLALKDTLDKVKASEQEAARARDAMLASEAALSREQAILVSLEKERETLLQGKAAGTVRLWYDQAQERLQKLQHSLELADQVRELGREIAKCDAGLAENQDLIGRVDKEIEELRGAGAGWQKELRQLEKNSLKVALSEHRKHLVHGQPCPLCGGLDHPYAQETLPLDTNASETLAILKEKIKANEALVLEKLASQAEARGRISTLAEQRAGYAERLKKSEVVLGGELLELEIPWDSPELPNEELLQTTLQAEYGAWCERRDRHRESMHELERLAQAIENSNTSIRQAREAHATQADAMQQTTGVMDGYKKSLADFEQKNILLYEAVRDKVLKWQNLVLPLVSSSGTTTGLTGDDVFRAASERVTGGMRDMEDVMGAYFGEMPAVPGSFGAEVEERLTAWLTSYQEQFWQAVSKAFPVAALEPETVTADEVRAALDELSQLRKRWLELDEEHNRNRLTLEKLLPLWEVANETALKMQTEAGEEKGAYERIVTERERAEAERKNLFGEKSVDAEEERLRRMEEEAEVALTAAISAEKALQGSLAALRRQEEELAIKLTGASETLAHGEADFLRLLAEHEFSDEGQFLGACLDAADRKFLEEKARTMDAYKADMDAREREKRLLLAEKKEQPPVVQGVVQAEEETRRNFAALRDAIQRCNESIGGLREKRDSNARLELQKQSRLQEITAQKEEVGKWETLNSLIGSSEGKKFRRFAQGLTFEAVVSEANKVLGRLSDRYTLLRDVANPLELNVCDSDQAGEIRSTRNLSGGESFIVSLALALGLSSMASRTVRLDSLFLDEGFGALDEDTLDVALDVLASLPDDGKVIGVISHVSSLKERIRKNIQVVPMAGGRSRLEEGEGVRRLYTA